jgi:long-chain acyl-CoA synthetase
VANRAAHLLARAQSHGSKTAIVFEGERLSFADLADRVRASAAGLASLGIGAGARVGIMIPSSPDFVIVQQALFMLGATVCPLNIFYRPTELAHAVSCCALQHLVIAADLLERVPSGLEHADSLRSVIMVDAPADNGRTRSLSAAIAASPPVPEPAEVTDTDVAMLLTTSATTGKAKGVMLTAANLAANYDRTPEWLDLSANDVILCALPLYNTFGLNQCINAMLVTGATMVLLPRFEARRCIEAIRREGCTFLPGVPTMLQKIIDEPHLRHFSLSSVRKIMTGGAPVPAPLLRRLLSFTGERAEVLTGYGLTEGTALVTLTPVRLDAAGEVEHGRTIGRVLGGMELGIRSEHGRMLGPGEVGEIVIRGPNLMKGYFQAPEDTAAALADGWLHSGDLGYIDGEGYAFIVDRKKDVIIRGGQNIYPADIEEVLYAIPDVTEAAVVAAPDDLMGEVPVAFLALRPGSQLSLAEVLDACRAALSPYKVPVGVHVLPELPKGPTGKILRRALRLSG